MPFAQHVEENPGWHHAEIGQKTDAMEDGLSSGGLRANNKAGDVHIADQEERVADGDHRRGVEDDAVECRPDLREKPLQRRSVCEKLGGIGCTAAGCEHEKVLDFRCLEALLEGGGTENDIAEARLAVLAKKKF